MSRIAYFLIAGFVLALVGCQQPIPKGEPPPPVKTEEKKGKDGAVESKSSVPMP